MSDRAGHSATVESGAALELARTQPLTSDRLQEQLGRLGGTPFQLDGFVSRVEGEVMLPISEINRLRRNLVAEMEQQCVQPLRWSVTETPAGAGLGCLSLDPALSPLAVEGEDSLPRPRIDRGHPPARPA